MTRKTVLYNSHLNLGADMVSFAGFLMPVRYKTNIVEEHLAVRNNIGMFDTSHMGRFWIKGKDAKEFLNLLVPRDLSKLNDGAAAYTFMLNENGGFKDDVIISQFSEEEFLLVCNAGNRDKIWNWIQSLLLIWKNTDKEMHIEDRSDTSCMIAVQGPKALSLLQHLFQINLPDKRFRVKWIEYNDQKILFSTTGYTGEGGGELMIFDDSEHIEAKSTRLWDLLLDNEVMPCALGSRDTLRLEAGYRLYGNDIEEHIHLLESGLDLVPFAHINKESGFIGQLAVQSRLKEEMRTFVGFKLLEKGIPRHNYRILKDNIEIGVVLSGTQSPLTKEGFGMALIDKEFSALGSTFLVDLRGKLKEAEVIEFPFYDTNEYGMTRNN